MIDTPIKECTMAEEKPEDILAPQDAAPYLARLWNREFTSKDFSNLLTNRGDEIAALGIEPVYKTNRISMWRRGDLAIIAKKLTPPQYREEVRRPRPSRKQENTEN